MALTVVVPPDSLNGFSASQSGVDGVAMFRFSDHFGARPPEEKNTVCTHGWQDEQMWLQLTKVFFFSRDV